MPRAPLICNETVSRVSSVLNRDAKQFGKKHMFDGSEETCWNSDQGSSQWVMLEFPQTVKVSQLQIQFQGGFASQLCTLEGGRKGEELVKISDFYPEDINALQISFHSHWGLGLLSVRATCCRGHVARIRHQIWSTAGAGEEPDWSLRPKSSKVAVDFWMPNLRERCRCHSIRS
ncbi:nuclear receptor 2C2-associated protein isoform X3 [Mauremys reevesii]|nr:nuclear receptor 2C2-associated protein isoform X3 [Mauremys reevesii]XP_039371640.1 nuclear receptor 2C2-associated protein isoform X3 [Mauremys reevesii]XP_039371641.1 nuclear receptor 2C2-associated protein isoform X3 [Mauremys reevesii]